MVKTIVRVRIQRAKKKKNDYLRESFGAFTVKATKDERKRRK